VGVIVAYREFYDRYTRNWQPYTSKSVEIHNLLY